ncbi:hypothetical protein [Epilithonimonas arachidiradicis]|uniref:Carboxypeptidase-like protein n=1 Tax=Epilithonimonas arachidiradicis TaxID=1617282 RepID=A0A420DC13_9FLAO|nr:hypothetical protein [Epilithonimonas arachidiradicis]RKE88787.1 hypothetical protein BXY58_0911 [Epilithonimonas arachidiradicis]GGG55062.1 hypothetical protein GCM10007332_15870 [Epilithonimonas arachidiradicis]
MRKIFTIVFLCVIASVYGQYFTGEIYIRDKSSLYLNQMYVTNLNEHKSVLANYNGEFRITAKKGDVIRFTSIATERKDVTITDQMLELGKNFIELQIAYYEIQEVILSSFKPTGNLRKDVSMLKGSEKAFELKKMIGLPEPKGDGMSPELPVLSFNQGLSFSIDSIFDLISGEKKKKERYYKYEKMSQGIKNLQDYFGDDYFVKLKIPKELIPNFLQFIYSSDNISIFLESNNYEATKVYIEKYLPIYLKRLQNSHLMQVTDSFKKE